MLLPIPTINEPQVLDRKSGWWIENDEIKGGHIGQSKLSLIYGINLFDTEYEAYQKLWYILKEKKHEIECGINAVEARLNQLERDS
jgi:hypothetical protein